MFSTNIFIKSESVSATIAIDGYKVIVEFGMGDCSILDVYIVELNDGLTVGLNAGNGVGFFEKLSEGFVVVNNGLSVGLDVGNIVGWNEGFFDGLIVGFVADYLFNIHTLHRNVYKLTLCCWIES